MQSIRFVPLFSISFGLLACGSAAEELVPTIQDDGPELCFDAVRNALPPETRIVTIVAKYDPSADVVEGWSQNPGGLIACEVAYENAHDRQSVLALKMDPKTTEFDDPVNVTFSMSEEHSKAGVEPFFISLSSVNTSVLQSIMKEQEAELAARYTAYSWTTIQLKEPGPFNDTHVLRLDLTARSRSNGLIDNERMEISIDGRTVVTDLFASSD